jgi:hypothetical protein
MNIKFHYLYRDGANYKQGNAVVFSNTTGYTIQEMGKAIQTALIDEMWFYANKWNLKDLHLYQWDEEIDHGWHEYDFIEQTEENATNGDIADFIALIKD